MQTSIIPWVGLRVGRRCACLTASILLVAGRSRHPPNTNKPPATTTTPTPTTTISFLLYISGRVRGAGVERPLVHDRCVVHSWVASDSVHGPRHATALLVIEGLFLVVLCQAMAVGLVHSWHRRAGSSSSSGQNHHEIHRLVARFEVGDDDEPIPSDADNDDEPNILAP